jgi:hypothetical protein
MVQVTDYEDLSGRVVTGTERSVLKECLGAHSSGLDA